MGIYDSIKEMEPRYEVEGIEYKTLIEAEQITEACAVNKVLGNSKNATHVSVSNIVINAEKLLPVLAEIIQHKGVNPQKLLP